MKFIDDLKKELKKQNVSDFEIEEIIKDHEDMINQALEEGYSESDAILRFGDPVILAKELSKSSNKNDAPKIETDKYQLWKSYVPDKDSLTLDVKLVDEDLTIQPSIDDEIHILYQGKEKIEKYQISYENGELKIDAPKSMGLSFRRFQSSKMKFIVEVPKALDFKACNQHGVSSEFTLQNMVIDQFSINTTSGDCEIKHSTFKDARWHTVSGDLKASNLTVSNLVISMVSGNLDFEQVIIKSDLSLSTVSGDVKIEDSKAETVNISTVSGDIEAKEFYMQSVKFKSVSGDCNINNKDKTPINTSTIRTVSGKFHIES
jgi:hypothetical protein